MVFMNIIVCGPWWWILCVVNAYLLLYLRESSSYRLSRNKNTPHAVWPSSAWFLASGHRTNRRRTDEFCTFCFLTYLSGRPARGS